MLHANKQSKQNGIKANFKYKFLSPLQNNNQRGTTLVVGVALGALMVGGTGLAIATASQNKTNVIAEEQTAQAMAAAEAGITRIQNLFIQEPRLAMASKSEWVTLLNVSDNELEEELNKLVGNSGEESINPSSNSCENSDSQSAKTKLNSKTINIKSKLQGQVVNISSDGTSDWVDLENGTGYSLVSYDNKSGDMGELVIQGRSGGGTAQIKAEFEAKAEFEDSSIADLSEGVGSLWVTDYDSHTKRNNFRSHEFRGDIKISVDNPDCEIKGGKPSNIVDGKYYATSEPMPDTPPLPDNAIFLNNPWQTLPLSGDITSEANYADGYYHYVVDDLDKSGNSSIQVRDGHKVALYVRGDIKFGGTVRLNHNENPGNLQIFGNTAQLDPDTGTKTYKYGCNSSTCGTNIVQLNGTGFGSFFIHAPEADAYLLGGGQSKSSGTPNFQGALWVKTWGATNGSGNKHPAFGEWNGLSYGDLISGSNRSGEGEQKTKITIGSISNWSRQPINPE